MNIEQNIIELLKSHGADIIGFADLNDLPGECRNGLPRGISIGVALDPQIVSEIVEGPTKKYYGEYVRVNKLLGKLSRRGAKFLRRHGFRAVSFAATEEGVDYKTHSTQLPHKTVATKAGLGWIGNCALLVTEQYGSAVRLNKILTDAELSAAVPVTSSRCEDCIACVEACPCKAPFGKTWTAQLCRDEFFNAYACARTTRKLAKRITGIEKAFCGICIAVCPYSQTYINQI